MNTPKKRFRRSARGGKDNEPHGLAFWWTVLIGGTGISLILNLWHALNLDKPGTEVVLGIIFAVVPALFAAMLSHGLISPMVGVGFKFAVLTLFIVAMLTSMNSQADVLKPYGGESGAEWAVPLVLDASAMLALYVINKEMTAARKAAAMADIEADMAAIRADMRPGIEADIRAEIEADMPRLRADIEADIRPGIEADIRADIEADMQADMPRLRADIRAGIEADMQADMPRLRADIEADITPRIQADLRPRIEAEIRAEMAVEMAEEKAAMDARLEEAKAEIQRVAEVETEARLRLELAGSGKATAARKAADSHVRKTGENGLTRKDKARVLIDGNPGITGGELGTALGIDPASGRRLLREIRAEQAAEEGSEGVSDSAEDELVPAPDVRLRAVN